MDYTTKNYVNSSHLKTRKNFHNIYSKPSINLNEEVFRSVKLNSNERILDIGCGYGDLLKFFRISGHQGELIGIDISPGMIKDAQLDNKDTTFNIGNGEELNFINNSFDIVICKHALYHFQDIDKVLKEIYRVLKNDGFFIIAINSLAKSSREIVQGMKQHICKSLNNYNFLDSNERLNFENYNNFTNNYFKTIKEIKINRYIELDNKDPFVDYMNSFREFWDPLPEHLEWDKAMTIVSKELNNILEKEGKIKEMVSTCIIVLKKKGVK